jgi:Glycine zipper
MGDMKMNRSRWIRTALAGALALVTLGAPLANAADRCDRRGYGRDDRAYYQQYDNRGYGYGGSYAGYRDSGYQNYGYRDSGYRNDGYYGYQRERSAGKSAAIIGGGAAAGAAIGTMAGGGKGAAVGAVVGGLGGLVYDRATKNRDNYGRRW